MISNSSPGKTLAKRRIIIVDNHPLERRGLISLIDNEADLEVCAEAAGYLVGLEAIATFLPDLVITEISIRDGIELRLLEAIRSFHEDLPVLVFSMYDAPVYVERALLSGAIGYVTKQETGETVLIAIRRVLEGEEYLSPKIEAVLDNK
jgi:DNA-binding NarL/FixJ family response regulator